MKISEFTDNSHIDEISAGEVGAGLGKATRAVGTGVKNFAKGFGQGLMGNVPGKGKNAAPAAAAAPKGKPTKPGAPAAKAKPGAAPAAKAAQPAAGPDMDVMKKSIAAFNPKQRVAIRQQAAKKAGVK